MLLEKLAARMEAPKHAWMRVLSSHPQIADRIKNAQVAIQRYLPDKTEYVITTSEFEQVKFRFVQLVQQGTLAEPAQSTTVLRKRRTPKRSDLDP